MNKSAVIGSVVVAAVIAVPLLLKSQKSATTMAPESRHSSRAAPSAQVAPKPLPRFVDFGTTTCIPCKVMLGVMAELEQKYPGTMTIEFVNVKEQQQTAEPYGITTIPTQVFFAPDGRELYRHLGVFRAEAIVAKWAELGFPMTPVSGS
jgi:thioredoxin 1